MPRRPLPAEGETTTGSDFTTTFGGKGANQAVIAARVGARVAMCAKVGRDAFGDEQVENFRSNGIDDAAVLRAASVPTGVAQITVDDVGANTIVVVAGANGELSEKDIATCAAPLIQRAKVVVVQNEVPPATSAAASARARGGRDRDPQPRARGARGGAARRSRLCCRSLTSLCRMRSNSASSPTPRPKPTRRSARPASSSSPSYRTTGRRSW